MGKKIRNIIKIDKEKCTGCGKCVIECVEGALQIINGKAEVVKESYCDGLGACIGVCPEGALSIELREAEDTLYLSDRVWNSLFICGVSV